MKNSKKSCSTTATEESIAFKYLGQDLYEKIEYEHDVVKDAGDPTGKSAKVTYQVNSSNELVNFWIEQGDKPDNVTIPETIGPYGIASIAAGSFNDNCDLIKVTIPASVTSIGDNAFKGCHNLRTVIYTDASTIQHIGTDAFKTQVTTCGCKLPEDNPATEENEGPELTFVGSMINNAGGDTVPFMYAMNYFRKAEDVEALIDMGGDVNKTNDQGETPLMFAVRGQCDSIIPWLFVDSGAKLDTQDMWGNTAFMRVLLDKNITRKKKLFYAFLDYGADLTNLKNKQGKTAWDMMWDLITHKEI